jgi:hypothetical protein
MALMFDIATALSASSTRAIVHLLSHFEVW